MKITVKTLRGGKHVDEKNFSKSLRDIARSLEPGMPVMVRNYSQNNVCGNHKHVEKILFFSDGTLSNQGVFGIQRGGRNFVYARVGNMSPTYYQLVNHQSGKLDNEVVRVPRNWTKPQYNEGTFSPAGGSSWLSSHSAGTEEIEIGKGLEKKYPYAFNALRFARDAVYFHLEQPYCMQSSLIREAGDTDEKRKTRDRLINRISCVDAVLRLIKLAEMEIASYDGGVHANQVGIYRDEAKNFTRNGYPVSSTDFVVNQIMHPCEAVAFVKAGEGTFYGETYILPTRKNGQIVERAFSQDLVRRIYPHSTE